MHAIQGDEALRSQFALDVLLFSIEMLVFMNQTGTDCRDCIRRRGYSYIVLNRKKNLFSHLIFLTLPAIGGHGENFPYMSSIFSVYDVVENVWTPLSASFSRLLQR